MNLWETIIQGGAMMVPLMACSVAALAVLIDRGWAFYANSKIDSRALRAQVLDLVAQDRVQDAALLCGTTPGPVSAVLLAGLQSYLKHQQLRTKSDVLPGIMEKAMEDYSLHALSAVEKRLGVLSTIGNAAPLFGMTGTVTGMITSFNALASAGGLDAGRVAAGISEALITTAAGLLIALGAVLPYHYFSSLTEKIELEIEEATTELLDVVSTRLAEAA